MIEEVVADRGYHSRTTIHDLETLEIRPYISEPDRGSQSWIDQRAERDAVYANRRRIRGARGKRLLRRRGELLERPCEYLYETGGLRRANLRGHENVLKRLLVHASAFTSVSGCEDKDTRAPGSGQPAPSSRIAVIGIRRENHPSRPNTISPAQTMTNPINCVRLNGSR